MPVSKKICCCIKKIVQHSESVFTLFLVPEKKLPRFLPGQFLHLAIDDYDFSGFWPESRVFSIAKYSIEKNVLNISYSVKGYFTNRMKNELYEDKMIWVKLPYGDFVIRDENDIVLIAGGTGITAFSAYIETLNENIKNNVYLAYGVRNRNQFIYMDIIEKKKKEVSKFQPFYFIENKNDSKNASKFFNHGILSLETLWHTLRLPVGSTFYLSGPPSMIQSLKKDILGRGIKDDAIKIDAWE